MPTKITLTSSTTEEDFRKTLTDVCQKLSIRKVPEFAMQGDRAIDLRAVRRDLVDAVKDALNCTTEFLPLPADEMAGRFIARNNLYFGKFKEFNKEYLSNASNEVRVIISASIKDSYDAASSVAFINKVFARANLLPAQSIRILAKKFSYDDLTAALQAGQIVDKNKESLASKVELKRTSRFAATFRRNEWKLTKVQFFIQAGDVEQLYQYLLDPSVFDRTPNIHFINPSVPARRPSRPAPDAAASQGSTAPRAEPKGRRQQARKPRTEEKDGGAEERRARPRASRQPRDPKEPRENRAPRENNAEHLKNKERFPVSISLSNFPEGVTIEDLVEHFQKENMEKVMEALNASRQKSGEKGHSIFTIPKYAKLLKDTFESVEINHERMKVTVTGM